MPYCISCADIGSDCPATFTTETREELMGHVALHADAAHPDLEMTQEMEEQVTAAIKVV